MTFTGTQRVVDQVKILLFCIVVLNVLDGLFTILWVSAGAAYEANPLMATLIGYHPVLFMVCKLTLVMLGAALLWGYRHHLFATISIFGLFVLYYGIILYQVRWPAVRSLLYLLS